MKTRLLQAFIIIALMLMSISVLAQEEPRQTQEEAGLIFETFSLLEQIGLCADLMQYAEPLSYARKEGITYEELFPETTINNLNKQSGLIVTEIFEVLYYRPFPEDETHLATRWIHLGCLRGLY